MDLKVAVCMLPFACLIGSTALASTNSTAVCAVSFQVAYLDRLNNMNMGVPKESLKDIEKRLRKYGDVCYVGNKDEKGDLVFFIHTTPAVYHGTHVYTNNNSFSAAAVSGDGSAAAAAASSSSTTAVPYDVDYSVFILDIEKQQADGSFKVLRSFDQKGLYRTIYGIGYGKGKHPISNLVDLGARWVHEEYVGGKQSSGKW